MMDTPPEVQTLVRNRYLAMTPSERLQIACGMFETAKALAVAGIRAAQPDLDEIGVRIALFDRLYGREVSPDDHAAIIARIRNRR